MPLAVAVLAGALVGADASAATVADGRYDVTGYDVTVDYRPKGKTLRGTTVVTATAREQLNGLALRLDGPRARAVTLGGKPASFSQEGERLVVEPTAPVGAGTTFRVRVEYAGRPGPGWLPTRSGGAVTMLDSSAAWFPVHADAHDKADFRLTARVPEGWTAVSVGRQGPVSRGEGTTAFRWEQEGVAPADLAVSIDRFTVDRSTLSDGTRVVNAYAPGLEKATKPMADRLPEILDFLSGLFGPYPFRDAGNVFVHVNDSGPGTAPATRPVYLGAGNATYMTLDMVVHEQAHQWYGVSAAPNASEDDCLSECFASYAPWLWDDANNGGDLDARYREQVEASRDDTEAWNELYRPGSTPGIGLYTKGPLALHALRRQLGDDAFFRLLKEWPQRHADSYAGWPRFEALAEEVSGQQLDDFFAAWVRGSGVPEDEYLWPGPLEP